VKSPVERASKNSPSSLQRAFVSFRGEKKDKCLLTQKKKEKSAKIIFRMNKQKLQEELKQSMLAKDAEKTSVLRLLLSAINYYETNKGGAGYEATDEDVSSVIGAQVKQRKDSIEQYTNAGRTELADKEKSELKILEAYLPEQMSEEEVSKLVDETIAQTGATSMSDIGKVMGALMPKVKGRADGNLVSQLVKDRLSS